MDPISDKELREIVERVVRRTLGEQPAVGLEPTPAPPVPAQIAAEPTRPSEPAAKPVVAIGADHGGFALKEALKPFLTELGYSVSDCGTQDKNPVDYPDFALSVARMVSQGNAWRGIMIDGAGIGSCMVANKVPGVRAALCYDYATAVHSREHHDANVLTLGASLIGEALARQIVQTWLATAFAGGRHIPRIEKIVAVEKQYLK